MRQIDNMTPEEIDVLRIKGMTADHSKQTRKNNALMLKMDRERERRRYDNMSNAERVTYTNSDR